MTYPWRERGRRHALTGTAVLATIATAASFLSPAVPPAVAESSPMSAASTTTTTAVPGSNCSAVLNGVSLDRAGWAASTNAPSSASDVPANALDGNYSTRFSTQEHQAAGQYFEVDLGSAQSFNELKMSTPNSPHDYARGFDVEVSQDGSHWSTVAACTGTGTPEVVSFGSQSAQYVKVVLTAANSQYWWSIDEFNLFGPPVPPTTTTTVPPTTTTTAVPGSSCSAVLNGESLDRTSWVASTNAPSSGSNVPANALDGNYSTRFSTQERQAAGQYFEVDLGSAQSFNQLDLSTPNSPNDYARGFDVEVSKDGSHWSTVAACTGTGTPEVVSFDMQSAQYVKVVLTAANSQYWWSIDEFNLFGPPPAPTTTTTVPPTTTTTVPPFRFHGHRCQASWPRYLTHGTLVATGSRFFVVMRPCNVRSALGARVLVAYHIYRHGREHTVLRWDYKFRLGSPMHRRVVELLVGRGQWLRWNGRLYRVPQLHVIG